jgi:hypothetical protein
VGAGTSLLAATQSLLLPRETCWVEVALVCRGCAVGLPCIPEGKRKEVRCAGGRGDCSWSHQQKRSVVGCAVEVACCGGPGGGLLADVIHVMSWVGVHVRGVQLCVSLDLSVDDICCTCRGLGTCIAADVRGTVQVYRLRGPIL